MGRFETISTRWAGSFFAGCVGLSGVMFALTASAQEEAQAPPVEVSNEVQDVDADADAEAIAQAQADEAADQAALASELASARRFEVELAELLKPDGQLDTTLGDNALIKLASLATRCGILANSAMHDEVRFVLLGYQARTLSALVSLEPADQQQDPSRLEQLKEVASQIDALALPGAHATADYWALLVSLAEQAESDESPAQVQALAEWLLETYIDEHAADEHAAEYLIDTRLSLARLLDRRGAQRQVAHQLDKIGKLPADSPRLAEVKALRDSTARLGAKIRFESISTQLEPWRSSDFLGKPVLIHIYADSVEPSVRMIDGISRRIVEGTLSGIAIVSLRVGEPIATTVTPPWPTLPVQLEPKGVLDQLGAVALPTLAWLDENGQLVSIGTTTAVLDQLASIRPKQPDEPADDQGQDTEAAGEQAEDAPELEPIESESESESEPAEPAEEESTESDSP